MNEEMNRLALALHYCSDWRDVEEHYFRPDGLKPDALLVKVDTHALGFPEAAQNPVWVYDLRSPLVGGMLFDALMQAYPHRGLTATVQHGSAVIEWVNGAVARETLAAAAAQAFLRRCV